MFTSIAHPDPSATATQRRAYGRVSALTAKDGQVATGAQVWGEIIHAVDADHLDVVGHFGDPASTPPDRRR